MAIADITVSAELVVSLPRAEAAVASDSDANIDVADTGAAAAAGTSCCANKPAARAWLIIDHAAVSLGTETAQPSAMRTTPFR